MEELLKKLAEIKANARSGHESIIQVKVPKSLRDALYSKLDSEGLTVKDLILSAIALGLIEEKTNKPSTPPRMKND